LRPTDHGETDVTDSSVPPEPAAVGLLTPTSRAVAGLVLAVAAVLGTNGFTLAAQIILLGGPEAGDPGVYGVGLGLFAAAPALLGLYLTWGAARGDGTTWQAHVSRAAVVVALVALVAAALTVVGGFLQF
jgi:hypothetical protein